MKINKVTFLSILLFLAILFIPNVVDASDELLVDNIYYEIISEAEKTVKVTGYKEAPVDVIIPEAITKGEIAYKVVEIGKSSFYKCNTLKTISIPDSLIKIGEQAFYLCENFTTINISKNSNLTTIENEAFYVCRKLTGINFPTSLKTIGNYSFCECIALTTLDIPDSVISIGNYAFSYCYALTDVELPNELTEISYGAFAECKALKSLEIPSSVKTLKERSFYNCISLETVVIPETVTTVEEEVFLTYTYTPISKTFIILNPKLNLIGSRQFGYEHDRRTKIYGLKDSNAEEYGHKFEAFYSVKNTLKNAESDGTSYAHSILGDYKATLSASAGYKLPENLTINVNGNEIEENTDYTYDRNSGKIVILSSSITGDVEIIDSALLLILNIEINNVTIPMKGQKPALTGKVPENANYNINLEFWRDENGKEVEGKFEAGKIYTYYCMVNPINNFKFGADVKARVNGNDMQFESNEGNLLVFSYKVKVDETLNNNEITDEKDETPKTGSSLNINTLEICMAILIMLGVSSSIKIKKFK